MSLLSKLFHYVLLASKKYNIDESHGLAHSMNVLQYANKIYQQEVLNTPYLKQHEKLIYVTAILHDMCDKKYVDEKNGIKEIEEFLQDENISKALSNKALEVIKNSDNIAQKIVDEILKEVVVEEEVDEEVSEEVEKIS